VGSGVDAADVSLLVATECRRDLGERGADPYVAAAHAPHLYRHRQRTLTALRAMDLTLTAAICDVAHQVIAGALDEDDLDAARIASATALLVAPDDEKVLLDAMWVAYREGNRAEAETYIARIVEVHEGDDEMDLALSTAETIHRARRQHLDRSHEDASARSRRESECSASRHGCPFAGH
jgi:hypothetical protein